MAVHELRTQVSLRNIRQQNLTLGPIADKLSNGDLINIGNANISVSKPVEIAHSIEMRGVNGTVLKSSPNQPGIVFNANQNLNLNHFALEGASNSTPLYFNNAHQGEVLIDSVDIRYPVSFLRFGNFDYTPLLVYHGSGTLYLRSCTIECVDIQAPNARVVITNSQIGHKEHLSRIAAGKIELNETSLFNTILESTSDYLDATNVTSYGEVLVFNQARFNNLDFRLHNPFGRQVPPLITYLTLGENAVVDIYNVSGQEFLNPQSDDDDTKFAKLPLAAFGLANNARLYIDGGELPKYPEPSRRMPSATFIPENFDDTHLNWKGFDTSEQ